VARLADMEADQVIASLCFPSMSGFSGTKFSTCKEKELGLACIEAYNDFLLEGDKIVPWGDRKKEAEFLAKVGQLSPVRVDGSVSSPKPASAVTN